MALIILFGCLALFLIIGVPVAFALFAASVLTFFYLDIAPVIAVQQMASGMNVFSLMAIPFFIFAGDLMYRAGIAEKLVRLADAALGGTRGGLGQVDVGASMLFGAVSGSAIASVSALGSALTPMMVEKGYDRDYAVNVTCTAAILGLIIPPSHNMIIYAASAGIGISIGELFVAGIVPGVMAGIILGITSWLVARKRGYPKGTFPGWRAFILAAIAAVPGLMTAVIIVVGILAGIFTPTESSAVAIFYTLLVGIFGYRTLGSKQLGLAIAGSVRTTAMVMLIIGSAAAFGWLLALLEAPSALAGFVTSVTDNPVIVMLMVLAALLVLGTFMDMAPLIIITTPIFLPLMISFGYDPVHFGIVLMLALGIGLVTPPVGAVLFVAAAIGKIRIEDTVKTIWPFYLALIIALLLTAFIPALSLTLPGLLG
ncbi:TRAP transporter large permease [Parvularcula marina]|uniref:TRAP transporter large permease protein n=1 Tax=Parvularcula marina TaxID=2292771 RepID=A0A371REQ9_9PROT|nr:TRAP transporter large permease [Parvularcula marina]RFB03910.1 TRAP transporter large permease [Parvularcula marina]